MGIGGSGASISYSANTGSSPRSGTVTFTQDSSGKQVVVNVSQAAKAINYIHANQTDEEIDPDENLYSASVYSDKPVASTLTVKAKIYLPYNTKRPDDVTFTIPKGSTDSKIWEQKDDPTYTMKVEIESVTPTEDSSYSYVIENN